jgi:ribosomal protein S3
MVLFGAGLKGMFFNCKGRFTRAQMSAHLRFSKGRIPLSTLSI